MRMPSLTAKRPSSSVGSSVQSHRDVKAHRLGIEERCTEDVGIANTSPRMKHRLSAEIDSSGLSASGGCPWRSRQASLLVIRASQGGAIDFSAVLSTTASQRRGTELGLDSGALLVREWRGKLERVMVLDKGFAWNGKTFGSLSQVAKAITGVSWNGHRFFGLRSAKERGSERRGACPKADENRGRGAARSKDLAGTETSDDGREGSKGIGRNETDRAVANAKRSGARLTRRRMSNPETKPHVVVDGEPRGGSVEVCP